jgi:hypothetical protein
MEEERSLLIDIVGDVSEVSVTSSSSEDSSMGGGALVMVPKLRGKRPW